MSVEQVIGIGEAQAEKALCVLVVEPDEWIGPVVYATLVRERGTQAVVVTSAEAAVEVLSHARKEGKLFDLVITTDRLPGSVSGLAFAQMAAKDSKVAIMTTDLSVIQTDERVMSMPEGRLQGFVEKPVTIEAIRELASDVRQAQVSPAQLQPLPQYHSI